MSLCGVVPSVWLDGYEAIEAVRLGRRFIGVELKREYWETAIKNLSRAEQHVVAQASLL